MSRLNLAQHQERLALAVGDARHTEARLILRALLDAIVARDIDHETAADAVRTALAALEGRP